MTRAELVEQAAQAWWEQAGSGQDWPALHENDPEAQWTRKAMAVVVDRIMPQVFTVAELEALPKRAVLMDCHGRAFRVGIWLLGGAKYDTIPFPLTVVWQP